MTLAFLGSVLSMLVWLGAWFSGEKGSFRLDSTLFNWGHYVKRFFGLSKSESGWCFSFNLTDHYIGEFMGLGHIFWESVPFWMTFKGN